jgi:hypothetical protein
VRTAPVTGWPRNAQKPDEQLDPDDDGSIPTFLLRGHPDCFVKE